MCAYVDNSNLYNFTAVCVYLDASKAFGQINHNNSISDKDLALVFASNCKLDGAGVYLHLF